jgi:spore germination protein YaaH
MPRFNCQRPATLQAILHIDTTRDAVIRGLVALCDRYDYDGINLDLEAGAPSDRAALTAFVAEIAGDLHRSGRHLSIDVSPKTRDLPNHPRSTFFDYAALSQSADYVLVMGWGLTWTTSAPGPQSTRQWLSAIANYVATMPNKSRFVLGTSLYGMDWPLGGGPAHPATALQYADVQALAARVGATPVRDPASGELSFSYTDAGGRPHDVWYRDAQTVDFGFQLARRYGLGISLWRLGREDPAIWQNPALAG